MKKIMQVLLVSAAVLYLAACGPSASAGAGTAAAGKNYSFKFSTHYMPGTRTGEALEKYFSAISEATEGHVSIYSLYSGAAAAPMDVSRFVTFGLVEIGHLNTLYDESVFPLSDVVCLPLRGADDNLKTTRLLYDLHDEFPEIRNEWEKNWQVLSIYTVPEKLLKGDLPKFGTRPEGMAYILAICVNMDAWNSLPEEYRVAIKTLSDCGQALVFAEAAAADLEDDAAILEEAGYVYLSPDDPDIDDWVQASLTYNDEWAGYVTEQTKGAIDGEKLSRRAAELLAGY